MPVKSDKIWIAGIVLGEDLTSSVQRSPSLETSMFSASQEILRISLNPKIHCRIHKFPPPAPSEPDQSSP